MECLIKARDTFYNIPVRQTWSPIVVDFLLTFLYQYS